MITRTRETEALAERLAAAQNSSVEEVVRQALEEKARAAGVVLETRRPRRRRMTVEEMLAVGAEIAAMPLLDPRTPREFTDDLDVSMIVVDFSALVAVLLYEFESAAPVHPPLLALPKAQGSRNSSKPRGSYLDVRAHQ